MIGEIKTYFLDKRYGFIVDECGDERFFHISKTVIATRELIAEGALVAFEPIETPRGLAADYVRVLSQHKYQEFDEAKKSFLHRGFWVENGS